MIGKILGKRPKIGLALGSGAAKGLAHVGIIKVLEKHGIKIDHVAGTSIGALIGALYCSTKDALYVETVAKDISFAKIKKLIDIKISRLGLIKGDKITQYLGQFITHQKFEDLLVPLTIVSADVLKGKQVLFEKGDLFSAIRSSISMPILFNPVEHKEKLLVDGGLLNPVPIDILIEKGCDFIIAVDLGYKGTKKTKKKLKTTNMIMNIFMMMQENMANLRIQNIKQNRFIMLHPKVDDLAYLDFDKTEAFIKLGEAEALKHIDIIKKHVKHKIRHRIKHIMRKND